MLCVWRLSLTKSYVRSAEQAGTRFYAFRFGPLDYMDNYKEDTSLEDAV